MEHYFVLKAAFDVGYINEESSRCYGPPRFGLETLHINKLQAEYVAIN